MRELGSWVDIAYRGTYPDGAVFEERVDKAPLRVVFGANCVPKGLERVLREMALGEERVVAVSAAEGFGPRDEDAVFRIPVSMIPDYRSLPVGEYIQWYGDTRKNKEPTAAKVVKVDDFEVVLDLNHPLAGRDVVYVVRVVAEGEAGATQVDVLLDELRRQVEAQVGRRIADV
ncbi:peptidylprolyl isomerase [Enterorhabdus sp. P55]|jgi:peptidylprolyl isomerase|uniref:FKBP-type peptidyl-prolyl cis-trans isomerase n=1 Tax=Enterorhabdus sp. P55 TaxID=2304571 RepID=UPI001369B547|nr:FKBP-type peptidyl-prolyl cis-trans isomerase [Enterorhabdus sp. P55]MCI8452604.1 hypothetical protein [Eggerthellaceae bacterium]NBI31520.1 hypothetical protein [Enterorhabdus sp. P55]